MLDTAATYSGGKNEILVGTALKNHDRMCFCLQGGMYKNPDGSREIDGDPNRSSGAARKACPARHGSTRPFLSARVDERYRWRSLSVLLIVSYLTAKSDTLGSLRSSIHARRAASSLKSTPQSSIRCGRRWRMAYSVLQDNGIAMVVQPCRAWLGGSVRDMAKLSERDIRRGMPRFEGTRSRNLTVLEQIEMLGLGGGMTSRKCVSTGCGHGATR